MYVTNIGEGVSRLSDQFKANHPEILWQSIKDARNFFAHNHEGIDYEILWSIVTVDVPVLRARCLAILSLLNGRS